MNAKNPYDAYAPAEIANHIENLGVSKVNLPDMKILVLAILAGAFIALGAMFYTLVITKSGLGFGPERLLGGIAFSLGLILVVVGGAELFTGNNLIVMAWADGKVKTLQLLRNWSIVYLGNFIGALATALIVSWTGLFELGGGSVGETAVRIAEYKVKIPYDQAFFRGIMCNVLVCLAIWLCFAAHTVTSKILAIIFPISAFVALGFEHSIANMYLIPAGMLAGAEHVTVPGFFENILFVTLGNIFGGGVLVAIVYWLAYIKFSKT